MIDDPVVEEIRRYRQAHAAQYDYDLHKICMALRKEEERSTYAIVYRESKPFLQSQAVR